jgi:hypothetical protein
MKNLLYFFLFLSFLAVSCKKENKFDTNAETGLRFSFEYGGKKELIKAQDTLVVAAAVLITVDDYAGNTVLKNKRISLLEGQHISENIAMEAGNYTLTRFVVIDADGNVLQLAAVKYSPLASLLNITLPLSFSIRTGITTNLKASVLSIPGKRPQDFGYASFLGDVVTDFNIKVNVNLYNANNKKFELTSSHVKVTSGSDVVYDSDVLADTAFVPVNDSYKRLTVTIQKDGYASWTQTLSASELVSYSDNALVILLSEKNEGIITLITTHDIVNDLNVDLGSNSTSAKLFVNWGDGHLQIVDPSKRQVHSYKSPNIYHVFITGSVELVTMVGLTRCQVTSVNLHDAVNLESIEMSRNYQLTTLDLSGLSKLKDVRCVEGSIDTLILYGADSIQTLYCSANNIRNLDISNLHDLQVLFCERNKLSSLNVLQNANLDSLCCTKNSITDLDISANTHLKSLECTLNLLGKLDVSHNTELTKLMMANNTITADNTAIIFNQLLQSLAINKRTGYVSYSNSASSEGGRIKDILIQQYAWDVVLAK